MYDEQSQLLNRLAKLVLHRLPGKTQQTGYLFGGQVILKAQPENCLALRGKGVEQCLVKSVKFFLKYWIICAMTLMRQYIKMIKKGVNSNQL